MPTPLHALTPERCAQLLHTRFRIHRAASVACELELVQVLPGRSEGKPGGAGPRYENFSLLFAGPANQFLAQGTYAFEHEQLGNFDLFIVPVAREQDSVQYQAVFNRLIE